MNRLWAYLVSYVFLLPGLESGAQTLPDWLFPSRDGRDFYVQGRVHLAADSTVTEGNVKIAWLKEDTTEFSFRTEKGLFEFFLYPNQTYLVTFTHPFTDPKIILFDTSGPPEKGWKKGFALSLDIYLEKWPDDFSRKLILEPYGKVAFNERTRLFEPDREFSMQRQARWEQEINKR